MVIVWSARASRDFESLVAYTAARSPKGAKRIADRILKRIDDLVTMPEQGSILPKDLRRLDITRTPYLLIFKIERDEIRLVRVLHGRRDRRS